MKTLANLPATKTGKKIINSTVFQAPKWEMEKLFAAFLNNDITELFLLAAKYRRMAKKMPPGLKEFYLNAANTAEKQILILIL